MARENYQYKPGGLLLTSVLCLMAAAAFLHFVQIPVSVWELTLYQRAESREILVGDPLIAEAETADLVSVGLLVLHLPILLAAGICSLFLIYRAGANANVLASEVQNSAGWAVGSFFIPILNLFRPYQAMAEFFRASRPRSEDGLPERWQDNAVPGLVGVWWASYLVGVFVGQVGVRIALQGEARADFTMEKLASGITILESVVGIVTSGAAIWMFRTLFEWQRRRREEKRTETPRDAKTDGGRFLLTNSCRECGEPISGDPAECAMCGARRPARRRRSVVTEA